MTYHTRLRSGMRGIEITLSGTVNKKQDGAKEVLVLASTVNRPEVMLGPFQEASNIEYDLYTQKPKPISEQEIGAYAALLSAVPGNAEGTQVQVTGRLHKQGATGYALDVRRFELEGGAKGY